MTVLAFAGYTHVRATLPADEHLPTNEVLRTAQPLFVPTAAEVQARFPSLKDIAQPMLVGALARVPLVVDNRTVGAMTLAFDHDREFDAARPRAAHRTGQAVRTGPGTRAAV